VYQEDTEILFPMRVAPHLRSLRGPLWRRLVDKAMASPDASLEQLAFSLVLIRLGGCLTCHPDSYRAMRGCTLCAMQAVRRFKGDDEQLLALFEQAQQEVIQYLRVEEVGIEVQGVVSIGGPDERASAD
jgi:hypothetical protein